MEQLIKKRYRGRGGGDKYYIDCSRYAENSNSIEIQTLIKNTRTHNVAILKAIATDETIKKKNRHIVVKISRTKDVKTKEIMAYREYRIGKALENIPGFIKYICLFGCYDDTNGKFEPIEAGEKSVTITTKICNATDHVEENWNYVLVMPYIKEGSLDSYNWTKDNISLLKNLIIHTVLSLATAFEKVCFIHGDLHLGNVLFKKTKLHEIKYELENGNKIVVPTMGYKVVIMDFEKAELDKKDTYHFWDDLNFFLRNIDGLKNNMNEAVDWDNSAIVTQFTKNMRKNRTHVNNVIELVQMIEYSQMEIVEIQPQLQYDPNVV